MLIECLWLLLAAGGAGTYVWLALGVMAPVGGAYGAIVVTPPLKELAIAVGVAFVLLTALHVLLGPAADDPAERTRAARLRGARAHWPLLLLFGALAGPFALLHPHGRWSPPLAFLAVDLRFWLLAVVLAVWVRGLDRRSGGTLRRPFARALSRLSPRARRSLLLAALALIVVAFPTLTTPHLRFSGVVHGDEPKYLRYCENLYQGRGFEVGDIQNIADLPPGMPPQIGRDLRSAAHVIPIELRNLASDAGDILRGNWHRPFNRAHYEQNWFVDGKNGGLYQVHTPGLSFLLFPGYVIDRYFLNTTSLYHPQFPSNPWATESTLLLIYALWGLAIFWLLRTETGREGLAWLLAMTVLIVMPAAAFPFQIYPETAAGLIIVLVVRYLVFSDKARLAGAFGVGLLAGYLPWLHIRFGLLSAIPVVWLVVFERRRPKLVAAFAGGYALVVGIFCFYVYHITGSLLPTALYYTQGAAMAFNPAAVVPGVTGFFFDGVWGMFAHAPIYLLACLGVPLLIARQPKLALLSALLFGALIIPSAGHGYTAAGGTPLRDLVAVMPLVITALAEACVEFRHSRAFRIAFAGLLLLSVQEAASYNLHHFKEIGPLVDRGVSGWHVNLLFPPLHQGILNPALLAAWLAVVVALLLLPLPRLSRVGALHSARGAAAWRSAAIVLLVGSLGAVLVAAQAEPARSPDYLMRSDAARMAVLRQMVLHPGDRGYAAGLRAVNAQRLDGTSFGQLAVELDSPHPVIGRDVAFDLRATNAAGELVWGQLWMDFGDGPLVRFGPLIGTERATHVYAKPGTYDVTAHLVLPDGRWVHETLRVTVV